MKMKLRLLSFVIMLTILLPVLFPVNAVDDESMEHAEYLYNLGLLKKSENGFELEREATRIEAIIMLIRLLGKEQETMSTSVEKVTYPYKDVPSWARLYVEYAYKNKLTSGINSEKFGTDEKITAEQFVTFILRALGYNDRAGDFNWQNSIEKAINIGLIKEDVYSGRTFTRACMIDLSCFALTAKLKNSNTELIENLEISGSINRNHKKIGTKILVKAESSENSYEKNKTCIINIEYIKEAFKNYKYIVQVQYNNDNYNDSTINNLYKKFYLQLQLLNLNYINGDSKIILKEWFLIENISQIIIPHISNVFAYLSTDGQEVRINQGYAFLILDSNYNLLGYIKSGCYIESEKMAFIETEIPFDMGNYKKYIENSIIDKYKDVLEIKGNIKEYIKIDDNKDIKKSRILIETTELPANFSSKIYDFDCIGFSNEDFPIYNNSITSMLHFLSIKDEMKNSSAFDFMFKKIHFNNYITVEFHRSYFVGKYKYDNIKYDNIFIVFKDKEGKYLYYTLLNYIN